MLFSTKEARQGFKPKTLTYISGGIHENVVLDAIAVDKNNNGQYYIRFTYKTEDGLLLNHTEFEPKKGPFNTDDDYKVKVKNHLNKIFGNQLVPYFGYTDEGKTRLSEEELTDTVPSYEGSSFLGYYTWVKETIEEASKGVKLRIKVVYDRKGYTQLPNYTAFVSVEPMTTEKKLVTKLSIDNFEPIPVDDESKADADRKDPLLTTGSSSQIVGTEVGASPYVAGSQTPDGLPF